jgi:hypothetical protein
LPVPAALWTDAIRRMRPAQEAYLFVAVDLLVMVEGELVTGEPLDEIKLLMTHLC